MNVASSLLIIVLMVAINALYVAAEFATVGARRTRVQEMAEKGSARAGQLLKVLSNPDRLDAYVAACQVGITLSSLVAGAYGQSDLTPLLEPHLGKVGGRGVAVLIVLGLVTTLQVVLGELLPKSAALRHPEALAVAVVVPMRISQVLFSPLVAVFNGSANLLLRGLGLGVNGSHSHVHSQEELAGIYRESASVGYIDATERDMVAGILSVDRRMVREVMTPRRRLVTVPEDLSVKEALHRLANGPHTRFPVISASDDVVGIVELRQLFEKVGEAPNSSVKDITTDAVAVSEMVPVPVLWRMLRDETEHCAFVVNEYGDVAGMVTLEDAIEEIFGEVLDEFDTEEAAPITEEGNRVSARGDVLLETLRERFGVAFDDADDVDTIGGYVWHHLGRTPEVGDSVHVGEGDERLRVWVDATDGDAVDRASFELPEEPQ